VLCINNNHLRIISYFIHLYLGGEWFAAGSNSGNYVIKSADRVAPNGEINLQN
jgi:hypothetical protein